MQHGSLQFYWGVFEVLTASKIGSYFLDDRSYSGRRKGTGFREDFEDEEESTGLLVECLVSLPSSEVFRVGVGLVMAARMTGWSKVAWDGHCWPTSLCPVQVATVTIVTWLWGGDAER